MIEKKNFFYSLLGVLIVLYLLDCLLSDTLTTLKKAVQDPAGFIKHMRNTAPRISFRIQCYHNEGKGLGHLLQRLNTYSASVLYQPRSWRDDSAPLHLSPNRFSVMTFSKVCE